MPASAHSVAPSTGHAMLSQCESVGHVTSQLHEASQSMSPHAPGAVQRTVQGASAPQSMSRHAFIDEQVIVHAWPDPQVMVLHALLALHTIMHA